MKVLITGAAGRLGPRLARELEARHELLLSDVKPLEDPRFAPLDVTDAAAARDAARGCDAVVHMAMLDWAESDPLEALRYVVPGLQVHVIGISNVLQAAWEAGARRFVYVSSVSAVDGIPTGTPVDSETRHYSNAVYGLTKGFGEDLCRMFHHTVGLSVAVLRLGNICLPEAGGCWFGNVFVPAGQRAPGPSPSRVHVDDVTRAIALALETPEPGYSLVHVVGDNPGRQWDLEAARRLYGWAPRYSFGEDGRPLTPPKGG